MTGKLKPFRRSGVGLPSGVAALVVTFAAAVVGGSVAWWGFPPVALAADWACGTPAGLPEYFTEATNNLGADYGAYGVKAGGSVGDNTGDQVFNLTNIECAHVSSVIDVYSTGDYDFAEVGWQIQQVGIPSGDQCGTPVNPVRPTVLYAYRAYDSYVCHQDTSTTLALGYSYPASVRSLAGDQYVGWSWQLIFNGIVYKVTPPEEFNTGAGATNGERHYVEGPNNPENTIESAKADFTGMKYWQANPPPGGSPSWVDWNSHECYFGPHTEHGAYIDPAFANQFPSGDSEVSVTLNASQC
jgi:hypothetical protein